MQWYIMTSSATDAETRQYFEKAAYFGLEPSQVLIFQQVGLTVPYKFFLVKPAVAERVIPQLLHPH